MVEMCDIPFSTVNHYKCKIVIELSEWPKELINNNGLKTKQNKNEV